MAALTVIVIGLAFKALSGWPPPPPKSEVVAGDTKPSSIVDLPNVIPAVWLGDSVTEGAGRAFPEDPTIVRTASALLGWGNNQIYGYGGTGYMNADRSTGNIPYPQRLDRISTSTDPSVFVVMGGGNDGNDPDPDAFRAAAREVLETAKQRWPDVYLIVIGPYVPREEGYATQREVLREEAARMDAPYIDPLEEGWMSGHPEELSVADSFHPNSAAQWRIGKMLAEEIRAVVPADLLGDPYPISPPSTATPTAPPIRP